MSVVMIVIEFSKRTLSLRGRFFRPSASILLQRVSRFSTADCLIPSREYGGGDNGSRCPPLEIQMKNHNG